MHGNKSCHPSLLEILCFCQKLRDKADSNQRAVLGDGRGPVRVDDEHEGVSYDLVNIYEGIEGLLDDSNNVFVNTLTEGRIILDEGEAYNHNIIVGLFKVCGQHLINRASKEKFVSNIFLSTSRTFLWLCRL